MEHPDSPPPRGTDSQSHYFSRTTSTPSRRATIRLDLPDLSVELVTDRGVFSPDRVDPGTKILLSELPPLNAGTLLDLGCGYGPITTTAIRRNPQHAVWAVDVNDRALDLCRENLAAAAPAGASFVACRPEDVPVDLLFDHILSNPPIRVGKKALHEMLDLWLGRLKPTGSAWLVVHKNLGADSLSHWLESRGFSVERIKSRQGYRILHVAAADTGTKP